MYIITDIFQTHLFPYSKTYIYNKTDTISSVLFSQFPREALRRGKVTSPTVDHILTEGDISVGEYKTVWSQSCFVCKFISRFS